MAGAHGQVPGVRTAESHRDAESLGGTERDVGTDVAGRGDHGAGQQVGAEGDQSAAVVRLLDKLGPVGDPASGTRNLGDDAEELAVGKSFTQVGGDDLDAQRFGAGVQDRCGRGEQVGVHRKPV